jgi:chromosome segregation ATPase
LKQESVREAKRVSTELMGLAKPAYELIEFDDEIRNSIMYAFSGFMICSSPEIAKRIAYHSSSDVACKCVSYEGDVF